MADLATTTSAINSMIAGSDSTGKETYQVNASPNQDLFVRDIINTTGANGSLTVSTTAVEATASGTRLANRKLLTITPTTGVVYWGYSAAVTTTSGTPIFKNSTLAVSVSIPIYLISAGSVTVVVSEGA